MIVPKLQGGLGNQMFQAAAAYEKNSPIYLDLDFLQHQHTKDENLMRRNFELHIFPFFHFQKITNFQRQLFKSNKFIFKTLRRFSKFKIIQQQENEFVTFPLRTNLYLNGYFQSERYFNDKREDILKLYTFPELDTKNQDLKKQILQVENSVSLHVRRGDYLKPEVIKYHGTLPLSYYQEAIDILQKTFDPISLFIFSDDRDYAKEHFGHFTHATIVEGNEESAWKDMALMSFCKHHIVANSSFSWWGAWLSQQNGLNIAPKNWFNPQEANFNIDDIVPASWLKI